MKFLYFTDSHIRATSPKSRLDNFQETLEKKFNEIGEIIKSHNVNYVLHGGDLFDRPDINLQTVAKFANIIKNYNVPFFCISGNHDIYGHNPQTLSRTVLGLLDALGIVKIINSESTLTLQDNLTMTKISSAPYIYDIDEKKEYYIVKKEHDLLYWHIHIVHGMLLDKPFLETVKHTLIDDIIQTDADITLAGHYHSGFKTQIIDGKYFINPGSLVRLTNSKSDISRIPQVVIITLTDKIFIEYINLKSAIHSDLVIDTTENSERKIMEIEYEEFKKSIDNSIESKSFNLFEILNKVSNNENVPENIKNEAFNRLTKAYNEENSI